MGTQITIGRKMTWCCGALFAVVFGLGYSAYSSVTGLNAQMKTLVEQVARTVELGGQIQTAVFEMRSAQRGLVMYSVLKDLSRTEKARETFRIASSKLDSSLVALRPLLSTDAGQRAVNSIQTQYSAWMPVYQEIERACQGRRFDDTLLSPLDRAATMIDYMEEASSQLLAVQRELQQAAVANADAVSTRSRWLVFSLLCVGLVIGALVQWVVRDVNGVLRRMAADLHSGAGQVANAAAQVASSSQSLAQGASEQAASLEETSASSEEINSMAQKNSENSQSAARLATQSQDKCAQTNQSLDQMIASMGEINASSDKISRIIKVIDEIAFQTNILALNAAVEAARAGEAGMGFAVVADEVRNLAQRCAQAAKDTSVLIEESIVRSREGQGKVDQVATAIRAVSEDTSRMKILVDEISLGSQEQARGIQQIGKAISQMERVTQSSAANAEESAAAAEELTAQSQTLQEIVAHLRALVEGGASQSSSQFQASVSRRMAAGAKTPAGPRPGNPFASGLPALGSAVGRLAARPVEAAVPAGAKAVREAIPMDSDFKMNGDFKQF